MLPPPRADNLRIAITAILTAVCALSFGDAIIKLVSSDFSVWQLSALRSLIATVALIVLIKCTRGDGSLMPISFAWVTTRSLIWCVCGTVYFIALPHVPFAVAASMLYTAPLFIVLFAGWFTGDRVDGYSWLAVGLGFVGVLLIVRPTTDEFNLYALLPLLSAILFAVVMIMTRAKCRDESPKVLALGLNVAFLLLSVVASVIIAVWQPTELAALDPFVFGGWLPLSLTNWLLVFVIATSVMIANVGSATAYQNGPSATVAAFDYGYLIFSLLWGFLLFAEIPDLLSLIGMVMIASGGILVMRPARVNCF